MWYQSFSYIRRALSKFSPLDRIFLPYTAIVTITGGALDISYGNSLGIGKLEKFNLNSLENGIPFLKASLQINSAIALPLSVYCIECWLNHDLGLNNAINYWEVLASSCVGIQLASITFTSHAPQRRMVRHSNPIKQA